MNDSHYAEPSLWVIRDRIHDLEGFPIWMGWLCVVVLVMLIVRYFSGGDGE